MKTLNIKRLLLLSMSFTLQIAAFNASAVNTQAEQKPLQTEIITVTGERPLSFFRNQFKQAENDFFTALNGRVTDEEFKIVCDDQARSFSHLSLRACQPKYIKMLKESLVEHSLRSGTARQVNFQKYQTLPSKRHVEQQLAKKRKEHLILVEALVKNDPAIQQKLLSLNKAKYSLEQKRVEVFGEDWVSQEAIANVASTEKFVANP